MKRKKLSIFPFIFLAILAIMGGGYVYFNRSWIEAGEVGVIYDASSGLQSKVYKPQAIFVGWRQQLYKYPTKPQNAVYTQDATDGEVKAADGVLITTSDNANTTFDISVIYRIKKEDVVKVFNTFGPIDIATIQSQHIRRAVKDGASEVGTQYSVFQLMGEKREEASDKLTEELKTRLSGKGITIDHAMILRAYPNKDTAQRINTSINSFTQIGIATLENQIAGIHSQSAIVKAKAEQEARTLTAQKTVAKSLTMLELELEKVAIAKWNGHLSPIQPQPGQTLVLGNGVIPDAGASK